MKKVQLIESRSEIGAGTRGASLGVDSIKIAALDFRSKYFKRHSSIAVPDENKLLLEGPGSLYAKRLAGVVKVCERLANAVRKVLLDNKFPLIISGDHSNAAGTVAGIKMTWPESRLGIIWIDAHSDIHTPYTTPSGNVHGMPVAALLNEDNREKQINDVPDETVKLWNELKHLGGISPKVFPQDLIFISLRDFEIQEDFLLRNLKIENISVANLRKLGIDKVCRNIKESLSACDRIYISFDVDSMDPAITKGTGTPVPGGLNEREAGNLIAELIQNQKVCCLEITEVNPTMDHENLTAENVFEIIQKVTNQLEI